LMFMMIMMKKIGCPTFWATFVQSRKQINWHPPHWWFTTWDKNVPVLQPSLPYICSLEERLMLLSYVCQAKECKMQPCWTCCCEKQQDTRSEWAGTTFTNRSECKLIQLLVLSCIVLKSHCFGIDSTCHLLGE
jgi:hypothetical protein